MKNQFLLILLSVVTLYLAGCQSQPSASSGSAASSTSSSPTEKHIDFAKLGLTSQCCEAKGTKYAIASGGDLSTQAGMEILEAGGNVVDAAVAVSFALGVERPQSTGPGGGGFMTLHLKNKGDYIVDFRETAPLKATKEMFLDKEGNHKPELSTTGGLAVATPGTVAGLYDLHKKWGKLPWKKVLEPAIRMADTGIPVSTTLAARIANKKELGTDPDAKAIFYKDDKPLGKGELLVQKDLAVTLKTIAAKGKAGFYSGPIAKKMAAAVKKQNGIMTTTDLARYKTKFVQPLSVTHQGRVLLSPPPPSSGGLLIGEMVKVLEGYDVKKESENAVQYYHLLTETLKRAFADRSVFVGDPAFFTANYQSLLSPKYIEGQRKSIQLGKATPSAEIRPGAPLIPSDSGTTHLSIMDADGNAVSATLSLNNAFGAVVVVPGTGLILNNTMDDFSAKPGATNLYGLVGAEGNIIAPGKRPVSSMSPTVVLDEKTKTPVLALGAGGGSKIISSILEVYLNDTFLYPNDLKRSVFAPRLHHQWKPDKIDIEGGVTEDTRAGLAKLGHELFPVQVWIAEVQAVSYDPASHQVTAVYDPRVDGGSAAK